MTRAGRGGAPGPAAARPRGPGDVLDAPVTSLPGIGPAIAARLAERDLRTVEDLLWFVPRRYDDARRVDPLHEVVARVVSGEADGERATVAGVVLACRFHRRGRKRWLDVRLGEAEPPPGGWGERQAAQLIVRWFNARERMQESLARGTRAVLAGQVRRRGHHAEMANPDILELMSPAGETTRSADAIIVRYPDIEGVPPAALSRAIRAALSRAGAGGKRGGPGALAGGVPQAVAARLSLPGLAEALAHLHAPPPGLTADALAALGDGTSPWHRRLAFEELFLLGLELARRRQSRRACAALPCPLVGHPGAGQPGADIAGGQTAGAAGVFPFELTGAQRRAIATIGGELAGATPMSRLLQGDVGAGKTAVAFAAAAQVIAAGRQAAVMAPTELLAEQHLATLRPWCDALGIRAAVLTSSTTPAQRRTLHAALASGYLQLVVGTHALLSEGVTFDALALVVIDEQHRFGVAQRGLWRDRADAVTPHLLVMTATPIPRTLALTAYGDLDVTVLDELPPGRTPPTTEALTGASGRDRAYALVRERLAHGERVFVVCPAIDSSGASDAGDDRAPLADVTSTAARLAKIFAPARVGVVHGRMSQPEREQAMARFRDGALDIAVATTVIEVGVDVPCATVMVVIDAQQFGLAQLHQLRGRVGRGGDASWCLLMHREPLTPEAARRLAVMVETCDGFRIAEEDLAIRGPGELFGARQSGLPRFRFGDLARHGALLALARDAAEQVLAGDPELSRPEHASTRASLARHLARRAIYDGADTG